jgi:hypothetical protein
MTKTQKTTATLDQLRGLMRHHTERYEMFCSELATHYYRAAGLVPFDPRWPAVRVPPSFFLASPAFETIWSDKDWF